MRAQRIEDGDDQYSDQHAGQAQRRQELPWVPVLQGWSLADYLSHERQYRTAGIDLAALPLVGVGTMCRRQGMKEASVILAALAVPLGN